MRIFSIFGKAGRLIAGDVTGERVTTRKRKVVIDGRVVVDGIDEEIEIRITGGDGRLTIDAGGDVRVEGSVVGDVTAGMEAHCGDVTGAVEASMNVTCGNVGGDAKAGMDLNARDIAGSARAGMDVNTRSAGTR